MSTPNHPPVSTLSLFGYLLTVVSWEFEIGLILLELYSPKAPGIELIGLLFVVSVALSIFVAFRGKSDYYRLRSTKGRIELSGLQMILVAVFLIIFGGSLGLFAQALADQ